VVSPGATLEARGGPGGAGGRIKIGAGTEDVYFQTTQVVTDAPGGVAGTLVIDPTDITITNTAAATGTQDSNLPTINFATPDNGGNTLSVGSLEALGNTSVTIEATNSITVNDLTGGTANGSLDLTAGPGKTVQFTTQTGPITFANTANSLTTQGATVTFSAGTNLTLGNLNTNGGDVSLTAGTDAAGGHST